MSFAKFTEGYSHEQEFHHRRSRDLNRGATIAIDAVPWCVDDPRMDNEIVPEFRVAMSVVMWVDANDPNDGQYGEAEYFLDTDLEITTCLVTAPMPTYEWGDIDMDTFGHEILHCFIGDYHE